MLKKIMLVVTAGVLLAGIENLIAQDRNNEPAARQIQRQSRGMGDMRPGQDRLRFMREGFDKWLNELTEVHKQKDWEKMGQLLEDMKQRRQGFQRGMGEPGRGRPPEGIGRPTVGRDRPPEGRSQPLEGRGRPREGMDRPPEGIERPGRGMRRGQGRPMSGGAGVSSIESSPKPKTEAEKKILSVLDDMDKNQRRGMMNVPMEDGRLLRLLTETVSAKHVVEIGTSNGYSGIWLCLALRTTGGKLTTYEIDARRASLARENFKRAGVDKLVTLVEGDAHKTVTKLKEPIDVLFIDADKAGYIDYLNKLLPLVRPGGLILAHNISMRGGRQSGIQDYVKAVTTNPDLETIFYGQGGGVSVTLKKR